MYCQVSLNLSLLDVDDNLSFHKNLITIIFISIRVFFEIAFLKIISIIISKLDQILNLQSLLYI